MYQRIYAPVYESAYGPLKRETKQGGLEVILAPTEEVPMDLPWNKTPTPPMPVVPKIPPNYDRGYQDGDDDDSYDDSDDTPKDKKKPTIH